MEILNSFKNKQINFTEKRTPNYEPFFLKLQAHNNKCFFGSSPPFSASYVREEKVKV